MRRDFVIWCYETTGRCKSDMGYLGVGALLFNPKALTFGIKLQLTWAPETRDSIFAEALQGIRDNRKEALICSVCTAKVRSYLHACRVNTTGIESTRKRAAMKWFQSARNHAVACEAAAKNERRFLNMLETIYNEEYKYVVTEHNLRRYLKFAPTYQEDSRSHVGAEGFRQGD